MSLLFRQRRTFDGRHVSAVDYACAVQTTPRRRWWRFW